MHHQGGIGAVGSVICRMSHNICRILTYVEADFGWNWGRIGYANGYADGYAVMQGGWVSVMQLCRLCKIPV